MPFQTYKRSTGVANAPTMAANAAANLSRSGLDALDAFTNQAKSVVNAVQTSNRVDDQLANAQKAKTEALLIRGHEADSSNTLRVADIEAREKFGDDEEAYTAHMDGITSGMTGNAFSEESAQNIRMYSDKLITNHTIQLRTNAHNKAKDASMSAVSIEMDNQTTDALNFANNGNVDDMQESVTALFSNIDDAIENDYITAQKGAQLKLSIGDRITETTIDGGFDRALSESVEQGEAYLLELEANDLPGLNPDQKKAVVNTAKHKLNAKKREVAAEQKAFTEANKAQIKFENQKVEVQSYINAGGVMDYKNKDHKASVNAMYDAAFKDADYSDPVVQAKKIDFIKKTGIVPEGMKSNLRSGLYSTNSEVIISSVEQFNKLVSAYPQAAQQFTKQEVAYAMVINERVNAGVPVNEAVSMHKEFLKRPVDERANEILNQFTPIEIKEFNTDAIKTFVDDKYNIDEVPPAMSAEYSRLFREGVALTGNKEQGSEWALKQMSNVWGSSHVTGDAQMMKYPPEQMLANSDGNVGFISRDWKKTQAELTNNELGYNVKDLAIEKEALEQELLTNRNGKDAGATVDMSKQQTRINEIEALETKQGKFTYKLVSDDKTRRSNPPSWAVVQVDEYGLPSPVNDSNGLQKRWTVNYADTTEFKEARRMEKAELERSRKEQEFRNSPNYEAVKLDQALKMIF